MTEPFHSSSVYSQYPKCRSLIAHRKKSREFLVTGDHEDDLQESTPMGHHATTTKDKAYPNARELAGYGALR